MTTYLCRFCPVQFEADPLAPRLCRLFCPACRALWLAASEAVARFDARPDIERVGEHCVVILSGLPVRGERAA